MVIKRFLSAAHYNSNGSVSRLVYKDVKSVAARAFNLENDKKNLLKGFMDGWDDITADVNAVKKAVQDMSSQNGLESAFKEYLDGILAGKATLDEDLKQKLTYAALGDKLRIFLLILPLYLNSAQSRSAIYTNTIMFPYTKAEEAITSFGSVITITETMV